jgi:hypothetical protein
MSADETLSYITWLPICELCHHIRLKQARFKDIILTTGAGFVQTDSIVFTELYIEEESRDLFVRKANRSKQQQQQQQQQHFDGNSRTGTFTTTSSSSIVLPETAAVATHTENSIDNDNSHDDSDGAALIDRLHIHDSSTDSVPLTSQSTVSSSQTATLQPRRVKLGYRVTYSNAGTDRALSSDAAVQLLLRCRDQLEANLPITYL